MSKITETCAVCGHPRHLNAECEGVASGGPTCHCTDDVE